MMTDINVYRGLKWAAIILGVTWLIWNFYGAIVRPNLDSADAAYNRAVRDFKDGHYEKALKKYEEAVLLSPEHTSALRGQADSLSMLGHYGQAIAIYDRLITQEPDLGVNYANRGIAYDRLGHYEQAIEDYEKAYALQEELDKGPGWLTRFLRNQAEKPPTIVARARYLKEQLRLPESERVLSNPEEDNKQRPYTRR